jgi:hypothetical protein
MERSKAATSHSGIQSQPQLHQSSVPAQLTAAAAPAQGLKRRRGPSFGDDFTSISVNINGEAGHGCGQNKVFTVSLLLPLCNM